jgi:hypothetical protein
VPNLICCASVCSWLRDTMCFEHGKCGRPHYRSSAAIGSHSFEQISQGTLYTQVLVLIRPCARMATTIM